MKEFFPRFLTLLAAGFLFSGCVSVDYTGQSFEPTPEESPIEYFTSKAEIPVGKYRIIGRGTIATTLSVDKYELRDILVKAAREHGADAVAVVSEKRVQVGIYPQENDMLSGPSSPTNIYNLNPDGSPIEINSFGAPAKLQGETHYRTELHVRALFLKDRKELEQLLARRGRELDALVKQPDPSAPNPLVEEK